MKKGLSVLLIAAALFGFYGGAVNLNDVLACKDYWEEEGERSTADMNKLEDGLNQLKDNEQAYLDGLDAVADGEDALAQGEADYAAGQEELAQGEADYAAAPGKLAAGEKALAAGKKKLAAGYQSRSDLDRLIAGLKNAKSQYEGKWQPGFEKKASAETLAKMAAGQEVSASEKPGLAMARQVIVKTVQDPETANSISMIEGLVKQPGLADGIKGAKSYADFDKACKAMYNAFTAAAQGLRDKADNIQTMFGGYESTLNNAHDAIDPETRQAKIADLKGKKAKLEAAKAQYEAAGGEFPAEMQAQLDAVTAGLDKLEDPDIAKNSRDDVAEALAPVINGMSDDLALVQGLNADLYNSIMSNVGILTGQTEADDAEFAAAINGLQSNIGTLVVALNAKADEADTKKASFNDWSDGYKQLKDGQNQLSDSKAGLPFAFNTMLTNSTIREVLNTNSDAKKLIPALTLYGATKKLANDDMDAFDSDMNTICKSVIPGAIQVLQGIKAEANKQLAQGEKDLAAGKKELAQGYADYKAAPGKLAAGRAALAEGLQKLMDGRAELAAGKDKLAEYEDGEQQVRDGLATLMGTEANGGLTSILDRRSGDDDFDNGDTHLDLDEGLEAVTVGRGYQADSGELITKEITNRAIGTAAGLGAGALAVLAAILSFLKKNKGAGVSAILSAVAGGAGVAAGTGAGMEFSHIAGSAVGSTPWIAFGVLAGVALVHAIAHFASKEA